MVDKMVDKKNIAIGILALSLVAVCIAIPMIYTLNAPQKNPEMLIIGTLMSEARYRLGLLCSGASCAFTLNGVDYSGAGSMSVSFKRSFFSLVDLRLEVAGSVDYTVTREGNIIASGYLDSTTSNISVYDDTNDIKLLATLAFILS